MEAIRAWGGALCVAALGCTAVQLLAPSGSLGRVFRLLVNTFFLCCLLLPLCSAERFSLRNVEVLPQSVVSELLADTVTEQLEGQVRDTVEALTRQAMAERGVECKKIEVHTDISEEGGIYIQRVTVTVDKQTVPMAKAAGEVLSKQWKAPVEVSAK